jgi:hypothetical protein
VWTLEVDLTEGRNTLAFWAEDAAGNSGEGLATAPSLTVTLDTRPPTLEPLPCACFVPEGEMGFEVLANGVPVMPAVYTFGNSTKVDPAHSLIVKAATRLSYGSPAPTLTELVHQEAKVLNVPFLLFEASVGPGEAPLTHTSYRVTCEPAHFCVGVSQGVAPLITQIDAWGSGRYLLPITSETVAQLGALRGEVTLTFTLTARDAAGNISHRPLEPVRFQLVAPPVNWRTATDYQTQGDTRSTFAYTVGNQNYEKLFTPASSNFPDDAVRLVLMRVHNPAPQPVAISVAFSALPNGRSTDGQYQSWESWDDTVRPTNLWRTFGSGDGCGTEPGPPPCPIPQPFLADDSCLDEAPPHQSLDTKKVANANLLTTAYIAQTSDGPDVRAADTTATGHFIVPAAANNFPGTLNLYISRPFSSITRRSAYSLAIKGQAPGGTNQPSYLDTQQSFNWVRTETCQARPLDYYRQYTWIRWLTEAQTRIAAGATLSSHALISGAQNTVGHQRTLSTTTLEKTFTQ